jgi:hypothetical protein
MIRFRSLVYLFALLFSHRFINENAQPLGPQDQAEIGDCEIAHEIQAGNYTRSGRLTRGQEPGTTGQAQ